MFKKIFILSIIFSSIFIFSACNSEKNNSTIVDKQENNLVGNDSDEHGCKASAGYSWCQEKNKCLRIWEEACQDSIDNFIDEINKNSQTNFTFIGKEDFTWFESDYTTKKILGVKFLDFNIDQKKLDSLLNFIEKNTEISIENQADSAISSLIGFRKNLDVCKLTYGFNNVKENENDILEVENNERNIEIICSMYK